MANNLELSFTVVDGKGESAEITLGTVPEGEMTLLEAFQCIEAAIPILRNLMTGGITKGRFSLEVNLFSLFSSFPSIPVPEIDSDVEEGAHFVFLTESKVEFKQRIPTLDETLLIPGTRLIDFADLRVAAYVDMMTAGIVTPSGTFPLVDNHGEYLQDVDSGEEVFRARKRKPKNRRG